MGKKTEADRLWVEKCAARMMKTLNTKPRHRKTQAYRETLPKRTGKVIVSPDEFLTNSIPESHPIVSALVEPHCTQMPITRKIRRTHSAQKKFDGAGMSNSKKCRPKHRFVDRGQGVRNRTPRDMETCRVHREILYAAQDGKCASCGGKMGKLIQASLDHVIPISIGGVDALGNLVLMHGICNAEKSNDIPTGCEMVCLLAVNAKVGALPVEY